MVSGTASSHPLQLIFKLEPFTNTSRRRCVKKLDDSCWEKGRKGSTLLSTCPHVASPSQRDHCGLPITVNAHRRRWRGGGRGGAATVPVFWAGVFHGWVGVPVFGCISCSPREMDVSKGILDRRLDLLSTEFLDYLFRQHWQAWAEIPGYLAWRIGINSRYAEGNKGDPTMPLKTRKKWNFTTVGSHATMKRWVIKKEEGGGGNGMCDMLIYTSFLQRQYRHFRRIWQQI